MTVFNWHPDYDNVSFTPGKGATPERLGLVCDRLLYRFEEAKTSAIDGKYFVLVDKKQIKEKYEYLKQIFTQLPTLTVNQHLSLPSSPLDNFPSVVINTQTLVTHASLAALMVGVPDTPKNSSLKTTQDPEHNF